MLRGGCAGAVEGAVADMGGMFLNPGEQIERGARTGTVALGFEPHAHDPLEHESQEADQRMGADALRQSMMDGGDLDVRFQDSEAALNVRERPVAVDRLGRGEIGNVG